MKRALITGITGQDGSYLAELLLNKGYEVHGVRRRSSSFSTWRIEHLLQASNGMAPEIKIHDGDMTDASSLYSVINSTQPDEIYNLAAQSHVGSSFLTPNYTTQVNAVGVLNILEAIRELGLIKSLRFYQASTSEMFGDALAPQNEDTPFKPVSPYAVSKLYSYHLVQMYREAYGLFAANGILFNHESSRRGGTFVTQKIVRGLLRFMKEGKPLWLGNLDAKRDWGHAEEYVECIWQMLQVDHPVDLVIGTGNQYTVKEFAELTAERLGLELVWSGEGIETRAHTRDGSLVIATSINYFRPHDVNNLQADSSKAQDILGWKPKRDIIAIIDEMIRNCSNF